MTRSLFETADILAWRDFIRGGSDDPPVRAAGVVFLYCQECRTPAEYRTHAVSQLHRLAVRDGWVIVREHPRHANTTMGVCPHCAGYTIWRLMMKDDDSDGGL